MKILVTGSGGFVGKRLVLALKQRGHEVFGFDKSTGNDILDFEGVKKAAKRMDAVFHLAASLNEHDKKLFETNVDGTKNALEASAQEQIQQFIFLSTVGVMGDVSKIADESTPLNPQTPYEKSKAAAEELVLSYQEVLPVTIVRSALVLGPNKEWKQIIKTIKKGFPLIGSGKKFWQIVSVDDLVNSLVFLLGNEKAVGETFIVAEQNPKKLIELVELIKKELGILQKTKTIPVWIGMLLSYAMLFFAKITKKETVLPPEYVARLVRNRQYSIEKIKKAGWMPKTSTEEAVKKTVAEIKRVSGYSKGHK